MAFIKLVVLAQLSFGATQEIYPDGFAQGGSVGVSIISEAQAEKLFNEFATNPEIPVNYFWEGCYARTTAMTKIAEEQKIEMGRTYLTGVLRNRPLADPEMTLYFKWHVAPVVYVMKNGKPKLMVFDPSIFKKPVTEEEWEAGLQLPGDPAPVITDRYYGSRFQFMDITSETKKNSWHQKDLQKAARINAEFKHYADLKQQAPKGTEQRIHDEVNQAR